MISQVQFEEIIKAADRIELMLVYDQPVESMHDEIVAKNGMSEEDFYFSYAAALCRIARLKRQNENPA